MDVSFRKITLVAVWEMKWGRDYKATLMVTAGAAAGISFPLYIVSFCRSVLFNLD